MECKARGAKVIVGLATEGDEEINKILHGIIRVPAVRDVFSPITASVPLQLLAQPSAVATLTNLATWRKALLSSNRVPSCPRAGWRRPLSLRRSAPCVLRRKTLARFSQLRSLSGSNLAYG